MKKLIILLILSVFLSSGCCICNLNNFVLPDDVEFLALIQGLDTPERICQYMLDNFTYYLHSYYAPDPYTLWQIKKGDCNDMASFGQFIADYHGYKTYLVRICLRNSSHDHYITIYLEDGYYNFSDKQDYVPINYNSFSDIVEFDSLWIREVWSSYIVYDYNMNLIEKVQR